MAAAHQVETALHDLIGRLNRVPRGQLPSDVVPLRRVVTAHITDLDVEYHSELVEGAMSPLVPGPHPDPADIVLAARSDDVLALAAGELHPLQAYGSGRLRVQASMRDLLRLGGLS